MLGAARVPCIIFGDNDSSRGEEPAGHIHCRFKIAARISAKIQDKTRASGLHELAERFAEELRRVRRKTGELDDEHAVSAKRGRDCRHADDIAYHFEFLRLAPSVSQYCKSHNSSLFPADLSNSGGYIESSRFFSVYFEHVITTLYSRRFSGTSLEWRNNSQDLITYGNFHTNPLELAAQIFDELFVLDRRQEIRVGVAQRFGKALHHPPDPLLIRFFRRSRKWGRRRARRRDEFLVDDIPRVPNGRKIDSRRRHEVSERTSLPFRPGSCGKR